MSEEQITKQNQEPISNFNTELDIILLMQIFKRNLLLFLAIIVITTTIAFIYLRYTVPLYQSQLILQVGSKNTADQVLEVSKFQENDDVAKDVELLKSKFLLKRALATLPLEISYFNKGKFLTFELYKDSPIDVDYQVLDSNILGVPYFVELTTNNKFNLYENETFLGEFTNNQEIKTPKLNLKIYIDGYEEVKASQSKIKGTIIYFTINNIENITNNYITRLNVFPLNPNAKTISLSFQDNNATKTADVLTALANEYIVYDIEERSKSSKKVIEFLDDQLDKYYNKVKLSENSIEEFQKNNKLSDIDKFSSLYVDRVNKLENDLIDFDLQKNVLTEINNSLKGKIKEINVYNLLPILSGTEYETRITALITDLQELLLQRQRILSESTKDSEALKLHDQQIEIQKEVLFKSIASLVEKLDYRRKEIVKKIEEIQNKYLNVPAKELEYARLQRVLSIDEKFFTLIMERRTEYSISEAGFVPQHTILDKAVVPTVPFSPNRKIIISTGVLLGIVISIIILILKYVLKNTISTMDEISKHANTALSILGTVPIYSREIPISQLVINKDPKSIISESFRAIRTNLQFIAKADESKLMAITSTISGEGKTFCTINLSGIIAMSGKKVIILDLDMRRPKIHAGFGVNNDKGMSTILIDKDDIKSCIHHSELANLDFITSGPIPPNPSELIISGKLDDIVAELKKDYDLVVLDNPPIGLVSDAMEMLKKADYPIYVFKSEYSRKNFINNLNKLIGENGIKKLSIILNGVDYTNKFYSYGYNYNYSYGNKDGYYYDDTRNESKIKRFLKKNKKQD
ncbi:MAG: polysaccharide biosynthesis tyrosine autokinase [Flavobacteriales bacterium]|nr:polysaccharide biosynthesis tyrosine autokinase [Flavobacteriales bacterium]